MPTPDPMLLQTQPRPRRGPILAVIAVAAILLVGGAAVGIWLAFFSPWPIDEASFPDPDVRAAVEETCDKDGNGELSRDEARAVNEKLSGFFKALFIEPNPVPAKTALHLCGRIPSDFVRLPLCRMQPQNLDVLKKEMEK